MIILSNNANTYIARQRRFLYPIYFTNTHTHTHTYTHTHTHTYIYIYIYKKIDNIKSSLSCRSMLIYIHV